MTRRLLTIGCLVAWLLLDFAGSGAQPAPARRSRTEDDAARPRITRADLANSYLRLEQAYFANPPDGDRRAEVNRGFDRATLSFFLGKFAEALQGIDTLALELADESVSPESRLAAALRLSPEPPILIADNPSAATLVVASLYPVTLASGEIRWKFGVRDATGVLRYHSPLVIAAGDETRVDARLPIPLETLESLTPGTYQLELSDSQGRVLASRPWHVVPRSLDTLREENASRLEALEFEDNPALAEALAVCAARNKLLTDQPSPKNSAQFLADPNRLAAEVAEEIESLIAARDPYVGRLGDYWRVFSIERGQIPLRVYAPQIAAQGEPLPLLVVLHGAGGDENMFLDAYGAGRIKSLAEEHGLLIASPLTYTFGGKSANLDALLAALEHNYSIDRTRVYCLGHSMGAGAAATLASNCSDRIAATCCIAGGRGFSSESIAPTLVIVPELDAVVPPASVQAAATKAIEAGLPVELRLMQGYAHTLVVGAVLPDAIEWLLTHHLASQPGK